ncbi:hypothetical protein GGI35DRAFT_136930 [Trichoderma velutinum]
MSVQRKKKRRSDSEPHSPQWDKLQKLRSYEILEQMAYYEPMNLPGISPGAEAESYTMDLLHVASWVQPNDDSGILFNPSQMSLSMGDVNLDATNPLSQMCCPGITPGLPSGLNNNRHDFDVSANWDTAEYSEMTSPSSNAGSADLTESSLSIYFRTPIYLT